MDEFDSYYAVSRHHLNRSSNRCCPQPHGNSHFPDCANDLWRGQYLLSIGVGGTALILLMAANTSYADFPRLAALQAGDGFLPRQLTYRGGRLVFSWALCTAVFASILVIIAGANTTALIPLYAIGVFLVHIISGRDGGPCAQIGKLKPGETAKGLETPLEYDAHWRRHMIISAVGRFVLSSS